MEQESSSMGIGFLFLVLDFGLKYFSEQGRFIRCFVFHC